MFFQKVLEIYPCFQEFTDVITTFLLSVFSKFPSGQSFLLGRYYFALTVGVFWLHSCSCPPWIFCFPNPCFLFSGLDLSSIDLCSCAPAQTSLRPLGFPHCSSSHSRPGPRQLEGQTQPWPRREAVNVDSRWGVTQGESERRIGFLKVEEEGGAFQADRIAHEMGQLSDFRIEKSLFQNVGLEFLGVLKCKRTHEVKWLP